MLGRAGESDRREDDAATVSEPTLARFVSVIRAPSR
jgi:hypothetical protein